MSRVIHENQGLLQKALLANALFSMLSGVAILIFNRRLAGFLGLPSHVDLTVVGGGLIVYAVLLAWSARRPKIAPSHAWLAVSLDLAWVMGSYLLLWLVPFRTEGKWLVIIIAELVFAFAVWQWFGIRKIRKTEQYV